jgi:hypothetical protein
VPDESPALNEAKEKAMAAINRVTGGRGRKAGAAAIEFRQSDKQAASRVRHAILLTATVMLGATMATHAFAAGRMGGGGFHTAHMSRSFSAPMVDEPLSTPSPQFNPSEPYTVPQSPELPVSPASPGSVFGNS